MNNTKILDKIKALLALADQDRSKTTIHEAENAMRRAQALMTAHNISMSALETESLKTAPTDEQDAATRATFWSWDSRLFHTVDNLFGTSHYVTSVWVINRNGRGLYHKKMKFFGLKADVELAAAVYPILYKTCIKMASQYKISHQNRDYLDGLTHKLLERSQEFVPSTEDPRSAEVQQSVCTGIMVIKQDVLKKMYAELGLVQKPSRRTVFRSTSEAFNHGKCDGSRVNLNFHNSLGGVR